ncbi:MAG TPA: NAD-dependent epimerase/dehydratase family protein [Longimicrobiales bacterium]
MAHGRRVFLTGATGFIGTRLARRLAADGDRLRCLVRADSDTAELERLGAERIEGDITDAAALVRGLDGVELAYHLAAIYDVGVVDERAMTRTNVEGTRAFLDAVARAGTPRAVYVSTTAALAPVTDGEGDENTEYPPDARYPSAYHRTKAEAHRLARAAQRDGLPLIIACPAYVYGPGDRGPGGRFLMDLLAGRMPGLLARPGWFSYVHVDDVVEGLILAAERGVPGETYVLSGEHCSVNDFAARAAALAGRRPPRLRFPVPLARLTGTALDAIGRRTGMRFPISRESVDVAAELRWLHSNAKAGRELGWTPRPLADGLPETIAWFANHRR